MKDHPHLRGAAESYNSLKGAFLQPLHLSRMMGATAARSFAPFLFSPVAHHTHTRRHGIKITPICLFTSKSFPNANTLHIFRLRMEKKSLQGTNVRLWNSCRISDTPFVCEPNYAMTTKQMQDKKRFFPPLLRHI